MVMDGNHPVGDPDHNIDHEEIDQLLVYRAPVIRTRSYILPDNSRIDNSSRRYQLLNPNIAGQSIIVPTVSPLLPGEDVPTFQMGDVPMRIRGASNVVHTFNQPVVGNQIPVANTGQAFSVLRGSWENTAEGRLTNKNTNDAIAVTACGSVNGFIEVAMLFSTVADPGAAVLCRVQNPDNFYMLQIDGRSDAAGPNLRIYKRINGAFTQLGNSIPFLPVNNDLFRLRFEGNTYEAIHNGVPVLTVTDASLPANDIVGVRADAGNTLFDDLIAGGTQLRVDPVIGSRLITAGANSPGSILRIDQSRYAWIGGALV